MHFYHFLLHLNMPHFYLKHPILICHIHRGHCLHLNLVLSKSSTRLFSADCHTSYHLNLSQFSYNKSHLNVVILNTLSAETDSILSPIFMWYPTHSLLHRFSTAFPRRVSEENILANSIFSPFLILIWDIFSFLAGSVEGFIQSNHLI